MQAEQTVEAPATNAKPAMGATGGTSGTGRAPREPGASEPSAQSAPERLYYYLGEWYKGHEPPFYDMTNATVARTLEAHYPEIRDEILAHYETSGDRWQPNYTPYAYREKGWRTVNLFSYFLEYPEQTARFPVTTRIVRSIPGMCLAQIAVLDPKTRIKAHFGDTNAVIRYHLGIHVPKPYPEIGIRVGRQKRGWEEGRVFAIQIAHRHYAWNDTDEHRIVLVVDTIRPEFADRRYEIAGKALAAIAMKHIATRFPRTRRTPRWLVQAIHRGLGVGFRLRLWAQRALGV